MDEAVSDDQKLAAIRDRIDAIDEEIQRLFNARAEAAQEVARIKLAADPQAQFYRPERGGPRCCAGSRNAIADRSTQRRWHGCFREIMSACLALEQPLQVALSRP